MHFGKRIETERTHRGMSQKDLAAAAGLPEESGQQTIAILEKRDSQRSRYASELAAALGLNLEWAITGKGEKYKARAVVGSAQEPRAPYTETRTGLIDASARAMIGTRLFSEIKRTGRTPAAVAARLGMTVDAFEERAAAGDFSLEDLAEIVIFLGQGASLDFIVLSRFPTGDDFGRKLLEGSRTRTHKKVGQT